MNAMSWMISRWMIYSFEEYGLVSLSGTFRKCLSKAGFWIVNEDELGPFDTFIEVNLFDYECLVLSLLRCWVRLGFL